MDELTRLTLRVIELENQKPVKELEKRVKALELEIVKFAGILTRIDELEKARIRQIAFNQTVQIKSAPVKIEKKSWLDVFKR